MQAMILAAGFGTRLRPYSLVKPKPLFPILNKPLLHILLDKLHDAGCNITVVNCHHLGDQIEEALQGYPDVILQKEPEILGTGGSLRYALHNYTDEPVLVMNGDIYHNIDLAALYDFHLQNNGSVTMAMHDCERFNSVTVNEDLIVGFNQERIGQKMAFTGIHVIEPEIMRMIPEGIFYHIIDLYMQLAQQGKIQLFDVTGCFWRDIGTPSDYLDLHRELLESSGTSNSFEIADEAQVSSKAMLEEWCVIGRNAVVNEFSRLSQSVVWDNGIVGKGQVVNNTIVTGKQGNGK